MSWVTNAKNNVPSRCLPSSPYGSRDEQSESGRNMLKLKRRGKQNIVKIGTYLVSLPHILRIWILRWENPTQEGLAASCHYI